MANGNHALKLLAPEPASAEATASNSGAAPAAMEIEIGTAVASAACLVAWAVSNYGLDGGLDPRAKHAGGERISKVALLQLDHGLADAAFADIAREQGKLQLRRYFDGDHHCSPADIEMALDVAIDAVLEITGKVVRDERIFRAAWAN